MDRCDDTLSNYRQACSQSRSTGTIQPCFARDNKLQAGWRRERLFFLCVDSRLWTPNKCASMYAEPSAKVWAKVKKEKIDRSEFRAQLKVDKYVNDKEWIESLAVYDGEGKA